LFKAVRTRLCPSFFDLRRISKQIFIPAFHLSRASKAGQIYWFIGHCSRCCRFFQYRSNTPSWAALVEDSAGKRLRRLKDFRAPREEKRAQQN